MKYMGSKSRFAKAILEIVLASRTGQTYVEPFAGGMNVVCHVSGKRIANDNNKYLIAFWKKLLAGWSPPLISREKYDAIRTNQAKYDAGLVGWVGFNCSYSGKWFGGYAGKTPTKIGTIRDYQAEARRNVLAQAKLLQGVRLENVAYHALKIPKNRIIYCDPPYQNTTTYHTPFDSLAFWEWVRLQKKNGHRIFVSEYKAPPDFRCVWSQEAKSSLSANGRYGGNKLSVERLFTL